MPSALEDVKVCLDSPDGRRIYVVVAEEVDTPGGPVRQAPGRMCAQACHAVGRLRMWSLLGHRMTKQRMEELADAETTTIVLSCRDSKELRHVRRLMEEAGVAHYVFADTNPAVYGTGEKVPTALATATVEPGRVEGILDYLPLWTPK